MQFSIAIITSFLATAATASPLAQAVTEVASPNAPVAHDVESPETLPNTIDIFSDGNCGDYVTTNGTPNTGVCLGLSQPAGSIRVTNVQAGCSFTVDTDCVCSDNPTIAGQNVCISGLQNGLTLDSFSVNC